MGCFQDAVTGAVDKLGFRTGKIAPEHKDDSLAVIGYMTDYSIRKLLPSYPAMGCRFRAADCQDSIQQQDSLTRPALEIGIPAHPDAEI